MILRDNKGQALAETALLIVLFMGMFFALIQLFLLAVTGITVMDAAHSMGRSSIVGRNCRSAADCVLSTLEPGSQVINEKYRVIHRRMSCDAEITYSQKLMFPGYFTRSSRVLPCRVTARMVTSPEPALLDKAYPEAMRDWN